MIKTEFSNSNNEVKEYLPFFALPSILYGLNFGLLGAFFNAFLAFNVFGNTTLFFGQAFVMLCLVTKGLNTGIIAVLITSISAAVYANDPYLIAIFTLEMLFIHVFLRKGRFLLQASVSYWLVLGTPLFVILHALTSAISAEALFINGIIIGLNGLFCVSVVAMFCWFLPKKLMYWRYYKQPPALASIIFSLCMLTVILPAMVISLFFIWQSSTYNETAISQNIKNVATQTAAFNDIELQRHIGGLGTVAKVLESDPQSPLQLFLSATSENYELFTSLIVTDSLGNIKRAAPYQYSSQLNNMHRPNVATREYFRDARNSLKPVISDAVVGKGFGNSMLISLAAPIVQRGLFNGIVQGSITLDDLAVFNQNKVPSEYLYVITDKKGRIISRSSDLNFPLLSNFNYKDFQHQLVKHLPTLEFNQKQFLYKQSATDNGWQVTILRPTSLVTSLLVESFVILVTAVSIILALFAFIARLISRKITQPLVDITEHFPNQESHPTLIEKAQVSREMVKLTHKLIDSHKVMQNFQEQLSEQVHNKTKQLKKLNKELYSIAQKDSLTQLLNRAGFNRLAITSYRNCIRNHINMSLILIDIDHFKKINDSYGHPFGDKCIVAVAKTIQKHCKRDTDIIGRYGGEEFIIMIVGGEAEEHHQRIEMIRNEVEILRFKNAENLVKMTISAGYCAVTKDFAVDYEDIIQMADDQLYLSKGEGRNRISSIIR